MILSDNVCTLLLCLNKSNVLSREMSTSADTFIQIFRVIILIEKRNNELFIKLVPKVYNNVFLLVGLMPLGT